MTQEIPLMGIGSSKENSGKVHPESSMGDMADVASSDARGMVECQKSVGVIGVQPETPLDWSADGKRLSFVSGNKGIYILEKLKDRFEVTGVLNGHRTIVRALLFHPVVNNMLVSAGPDGILIWDSEKHTLVKSINGRTSHDAHESAVECLLWVDNGRFLISGSKDYSIKIWAVEENWTCVETILGHKAAVLSMSYCPVTRTMVSAGRDSAIKLWDMGPLIEIKSASDSSLKVALVSNIDGHRGDITRVRFNKEGTRIYSGARDNDIKIWDVASGRELETIQRHKADIRQLVLMGGEKYLLTAAGDGRVRLWKLAPPEVPAVAGTINVAETVAMVDEGAGTGLAAAAEAEDPSAVDPAGVVAPETQEIAQLVHVLNAHSDDLIHMEVGASGLMATSSSSSCVRIWSLADMANPQLVHEFVGHRESITGLTLVNDDTNMFSGSSDFQVFLYDAKETRRLAKTNFSASVFAMAATNDGSLVFVGGTDYVIRAYARAEGDLKEVGQFVGHSGKVQCLAVSPDESILVSGGHDFSLKTWKLQKNAMLQVTEDPVVSGSSHDYDDHRGHILGMAFNSDGTLLASCGTNHAIVVWKVNGTRLNDIWTESDAHSFVVSAVTWGCGQSKHMLLSCSWDATVKVWAPDSRNKSYQVLRTLKGHQTRVADVAVTKDGNYCLSAGADCTIRCWSLHEPDDFACKAVYVAPATELGFSKVCAGLKFFVSGSDNGMLRVWPYHTDSEYSTYFTDLKSAAILDKNNDDDDDQALPLGQQEKIDFSM